ncbi:response regulator transcription factor [Periweissella fabaria]|uniref:Uncharacterized protein n=1 Tax=Periweissella fabaria TaxID=546157 RepID=A0ABM8Z576_9LACO|nr:LytTR family DNA-binding domain-containing protein [Periweissella fabaria]MCM0596612.1 response regulator transcription factor [Periweissella fabaria]CAH0416463.1 hypothetical protein WFA24289_00767 [Periweissella fabaria]
MRIYILDDQFVILDKIKRLVTEITHELDIDAHIKIFTNTDDLEEVVFNQGQYADVYFLDLDQNGVKLSGVAFAKQLRQFDIEATISFISKFPMLMQQLFANNIGAHDFINKSQANNVLKGYLAQTIKYRQRFFAQIKPQQKLLINAVNQVYLVKPHEIIAIETTATAHQLKLTTKHDDILFYERLNDLQGRLPQLFRGHRACLINLDYVTQIKLKERLVVLDNHLELPVSRTKIKSLCELITINDLSVTI